MLKPMNTVSMLSTPKQLCVDIYHKMKIKAKAVNRWRLTAFKSGLICICDGTRWHNLWSVLKWKLYRFSFCFLKECVYKTTALLLVSQVMSIHSYDKNYEITYIQSLPFTNDLNLSLIRPGEKAKDLWVILVIKSDIFCVTT